MSGMKKYACVLPGLWAAGLLIGCAGAPVPDTPATDEHGGVSAAGKPQGYVALPGQAATSSTPSETTMAFEFAAAAYGAGGSAPATSAAGLAQPGAQPTPAPPTSQKTIDTVLNPPPVNVDDELPLHTAASPNAAQPRPTAPAAMANAMQPPPATNDPSSYAVQVTNGTSGRLFVEMRDESGNIFPFGFMYAGQRMGAQPQDARPIQGHLTVIIRDPDLPGAPEVRRYEVAPPAQYSGKTLGITILPGRYRASVDGQVYYTSPSPEEMPPTPADQ